MDDVGELLLQHENYTIDVAHKGCFGSSYDTVACARSGLLSSVMTVMALLCAVRVLQLHHEKHTQLHHYLIFYAATIECIVSAGYWSCGKQYPRVDFAQSYLKFIHFMVICHFYWCMAMRIIHKEALVNRVVVPILALYGGYFTAVIALGVSDVKSTWIACLEPEWLLLSAAEFLAVQLFALAGVYITKKLNQISSDETFKSEQKRDLWSVIIVYEASALISLTYDSAMKILGDDKIGCSGIFRHDQMLYSLIFAFFTTVKYILPLWIILCVFQPSPSLTIEQESIFGWSFDGSSAATSVFRPHCVAGGVGGNLYWRQLRFSAVGNHANQAIIDGLPFGKGGAGSAMASSFSDYNQRYVSRLQSTLTPITEEEGAVSESLGSDRSSGMLAPDNQPLLTCVSCTSKPC